jgi:hypothetical protein
MKEIYLSKLNWYRNEKSNKTKASKVLKKYVFNHFSLCLLFRKIVISKKMCVTQEVSENEQVAVNTKQTIKKNTTFLLNHYSLTKLGVKFIRSEIEKLGMLS